MESYTEAGRERATKCHVLLKPGPVERAFTKPLSLLRSFQKSISPTSKVSLKVITIPVRAHHADPETQETRTRSEVRFHVFFKTCTSTFPAPNVFLVNTVCSVFVK